MLPLAAKCKRASPPVLCYVLQKLKFCPLRRIFLSFFPTGEADAFVLMFLSWMQKRKRRKESTCTLQEMNVAWTMTERKAMGWLAVRSLWFNGQVDHIFPFSNQQKSYRYPWNRRKAKSARSACEQANFILADHCFNPVHRLVCLYKQELLGGKPWWPLLHDLQQFPGLYFWKKGIFPEAIVWLNARDI